jgi:hypothetical protein
VATTVNADDSTLSWDVLRRIFLSPTHSPARQAAAEWLLDVLSEHLGPVWPAKACGSDDDLRKALVNSGVLPQGFGTLLDLSLRLHQFRKASGFAQLRRDLRTDVRFARFLHHRVALEVGALSERDGASVSFEPVVEGIRGPADVCLAGDQKIVVEVRVLETDQDFRRIDQQFDRLKAERFSLMVEHHVDIEVDAEELPDKETLERVVALMREVAKEAAQNARWVDRNLGPRVRVAAGPELTGGSNTLSGPMYQSTDALKRLRGALTAKAAKYEGGSPVWLRVDVLDGLFAISDWAQMPLPQQLTEISHALRHTLLAASGVAGVVLTSGAISMESGIVGQSVRDGATGSYALHRQLPLRRGRATFIVPLGDGGADDADRWLAMYDNEPNWLAGALADVGLPALKDLDPGWTSQENFVDGQRAR